MISKSLFAPVTRTDPALAYNPPRRPSPATYHVSGPAADNSIRCRFAAMTERENPFLMAIVVFETVSGTIAPFSAPSSSPRFLPFDGPTV